MLNPQAFTAALERAGFAFFSGVPDSLLKELCACISEVMPPERHIIAANEGGAVALAAGYHLATGGAGVVYMQNSGLGNATNPLLSLADPEVYAVPMLLIVGWRGEPGGATGTNSDEPQHVKQGRIQERLIEALGYHHEVLSPEQAEAEAQLARLAEIMHRDGAPVVLSVRRNTFGAYEGAGVAAEPAPHKRRYPMLREEALRIILELLEETARDARIVSTTGKTSRELYELREARGEGHERDFLTVGSMGHAAMIALGLARFAPDCTVVCIDGDGAVLMHTGALGIVGCHGPRNLLHIVINNGAHESVGGQETIGFELEFAALAERFGYHAAARAETAEELRAALGRLLAGRESAAGPCLLEVRVRTGSRPDLGRPRTTPAENKTAFMRALQHEQRPAQRTELQ